MKRFFVIPTYLLVVAAGSLCISAQTRDGAIPCGPDAVNRNKEIKRIPPAATHTDETGAIVYTINGNESWRRTDIEVKDDGCIEFMVNDDVLDDNSGLFEVKVNVRPSK